MHVENYYTYIMASRSRTLYVGVTSDLHGRVFKHKGKEYGGFTAKYNCDRLVWFEAFREAGEAILREKELKGWRREKKLTLMNASNPAWVDLAREWYAAEPADFVRG
jgi:putative endonuclease